MNTTDIIIAVLSGGVGVAIVKGIFELIALWRKRKHDIEDKSVQDTESRLRSIEAKTDAQSEALRYLLYDRIRYLGQEYIVAKEIDIDDRKILKQMHESYHKGLGGNGDLDLLMKQVDSLPLKVKH